MTFAAYFFISFSDLMLKSITAGSLCDDEPKETDSAKTLTV